jgi:tetratricopeptide (TPR) repeat protein
MKTHTLKLISLAFGIVFLTSCSELLYTTVDVLRPAKVAFSPNVHNLLIVNNSVTQPSEYGHRTELISMKTKNVVIETDSLAIFALGSLTEGIEGKGFFNSVRLLPNSVNKSKLFAAVDPLEADSVAKLCTLYHADAIISLDRIKVNDDLSEYFSSQSNSFLGVLEARFESYWSIHYPDSSKLTQLQFKDTVYWESESYIRKKAISGLPNREDALIDGALNVGKKTIDRFVPYWDKEDRYLYSSPNKYIIDGMDSVYVKNWKSAIDSWEKALDKSHNSWVKAQAANNIAVAYEIIGNIDKSLDYATQAYYNLGKSYFSDYAVFMRLSNYIEDLNQRKMEIEKLKKQLCN